MRGLCHRKWLAAILRPSTNDHVLLKLLNSRTRVHRQSISSQSDTQSTIKFAIDPYNHTEGHWLERDVLQKRARHVQFDFPALCEKVLECCSGSNTIIDCEKREGAFNRVFIFTMDNKRKAVARIPNRVAGPPRLTTNSEVATMRLGEFIDRCNAP